MCRRVTCKTCQQPTYAGCGMHVEQVLRDVPRDERCRCRTTGAPTKAAKASKAATSATAAPAAARGRRWFRRSAAAPR